MSDNLKLGQLIEGEQHRDAVHVAVAPVIADVPLLVGQHVGLTVDGKANPHKTPIGIVDPFLKDSVGVGQAFWLFLYPGSVDSLRHEWRHLAFDGPEMKLSSEAWLREFCRTADCPKYETVMLAIQDRFDELGPPECYSGNGYIDSNYLHFDGRDAHGDIPDEFWRHAEIVLGTQLTTRPRRFSCSC